jgi:hypothetical protein
MAAAGTKTETTPETRTPRTRNGRACTVIDTKIVDHVCRAGSSNSPAMAGRSRTAATSATG